eukprot:NODE_950_length_2933_cov_0.834157.p4 type:complete len:116 gc:universal NODE_950_length_2933_cov_0.834157:1004-657(-)
MYTPIKMQQIPWEKREITYKLVYLKLHSMREVFFAKRKVGLQITSQTRDFFNGLSDFDINFFCQFHILFIKFDFRDFIFEKSCLISLLFSDRLFKQSIFYFGNVNRNFNFGAGRE